MNASLPLSVFIRKKLDPITEEWRAFAQIIAPKGTSDFVLRNHIHQLLFFIADDIEANQSEEQQKRKSQGKNDEGNNNPGALHAQFRFNAGYNMVQMVAEFRALRATVIKLWTKTRIVLTDSDMLDLIRFNEAIDQLLTESVASFIENYQLKPKSA